MKKIFAIFAAAAMLMTTAACSEISGSEYPVKIAGYSFDARPESVVCLSDSVADILISCGYADIITAKSDECTQEELANVPSVGPKSDPSIKKIESVSPDVVFTDKTVSGDISEKIDNDNIKVMNMVTAQNGDELKVLYESLSSIMEGRESGKVNGGKKATSLLITLDDLQRLIPESNIPQTACYLYNTNYEAVTNESFSGKLFEYANIINVCSGCVTAEDVQNAVNRDNPQYIFCPVGVKDKIMSDENFASVNAVLNGQVYEIDENVFQRQGDTMTEVLSYIIETVYPELKGDQKENQDSKEESEQASAEESEDETKEPSEQESIEQTSKAESSEIKADNSLKITEDTAFGQGDEDDDIKKIQKRLKTLGYGEFKDGITGYFGEQTAAAFKAFQKNNGLDSDGYASPEALTILFSADVKPAKNNDSQ